MEVKQGSLGEKPNTLLKIKVKNLTNNKEKNKESILLSGLDSMM